RPGRRGTRRDRRHRAPPRRRAPRRARSGCRGCPSTARAAWTARLRGVTITVRSRSLVSGPPARLESSLGAGAGEGEVPRVLDVVVMRTQPGQVRELGPAALGDRFRMVDLEVLLDVASRDRALRVELLERGA